MLFFNKNYIKKTIKKDLIILLIIMILPFAFFLYKIVPETKVWNNDWFIIDSGYFGNTKLFIWFLTVKIMTLVLLSVWFVTCKYFWRYIIFIPIAAEIHKLFSLLMIFKHNYEYKLNMLEPLIITLPFLIILLLISKSLGYYKFSKTNNKIVNDEINNQMIKLSKFDTNNYKFIKKELIELMKKKNSIDEKSYLIKLIELRDKLTV